MKTRPTEPARWSFGPHDGVPYSPDYDDRYHPRAGALAQTRHVFLAGNGLPERWQGRGRFVVLETGFGLGNNFLATWAAWRADPQRCTQLHFVSIERHPLRRADLERVHADSPLRALADALIDAWPPLTPNLHPLSFDNGQVQLLLAFGDVASLLPQLRLEADAFFLDGFAPAHNPEMWQARVCKALARLAARGATVATWSAAREVRDGLRSAGFEPRLAAGIGGKRDITLARYAPAFAPRRAPAMPRRPAPAPAPSGQVRPQHALVIGAGLAGCAAAWALAEQGWHSTLIDRHATPAQEASGNPGGLFHGIFNPQDGVHARFNRAAGLQARQAVMAAIADHGAAGAADGLLRLEPDATDASELREQLARSGLPAEYLQLLDADEASAKCGFALRHPAWFYPGGGWVDPGALARSYLARAGGAARFCGDSEVHSIAREPDGWAARDPHGRLIERAEALVLANAFDALRLLGEPGWPVHQARGQISIAPAGAGGLLPHLPTLPLAGAGYLLPRTGAGLLFGATSQIEDDDPSVRDADHAHNLAQLARLIGLPPGSLQLASLRPENLQGRIGWRMASRDRLPIIGAVPDPALAPTRSTASAIAGGPRLDHARFVPRLPGLFVYIALGSRGITWSALGAQVLASTITGAPLPLEADLLDAIDPARFIVRESRRAAADRWRSTAPT
jgi:tRNA 5-methylaminomethyl-2-thiouridine biosynthesis bifunctional protein